MRTDWEKMNESESDNDSPDIVKLPDSGAHLTKKKQKDKHRKVNNVRIPGPCPGQWPHLYKLFSMKRVNKNNANYIMLCMMCLPRIVEISAY